MYARAEHISDNISPSSHANWNTFIKSLGDAGCSTIAEKVIYQRPGYPADEIAASWNISLIGTRVSAAGRGLGTKLIQFAIDKAQQCGCGVWVPTTYTPRVSGSFSLRLTLEMRFYEKVDFVHVQTKSVTNPFGDWAEEYVMLRPF
jgi:GNAT superfamily N-acetyltransferase